jgi:energy-coupling factor transporter ATP-binding protein EcfA2
MSWSQTPKELFSYIQENYTNHKKILFRGPTACGKTTMIHTIPTLIRKDKSLSFYLQALQSNKLLTTILIKKESRFLVFLTLEKLNQPIQQLLLVQPIQVLTIQIPQSIKMGIPKVYSEY